MGGDMCLAVGDCRLHTGNLDAFESPRRPDERIHIGRRTDVLAARERIRTCAFVLEAVLPATEQND